MVCPKCGFEQPPAVACAQCGIIVRRYRPRPQATEDPAPDRAALPTASERLRRVAGEALRVLVVALLGAWAYRSAFPEARPQPPPRVAAVRPPPAPTWPTRTAAPERAAPEAGELSLAVAPSPPVETLPTESCPISDRGLAAPPGRGSVSWSWYSDRQFDVAQREQADAAAAMVVYVYTDWCRYCRAFERELLSAPELDRYLRDTAVKVRINPETSAAARSLADQLGVDRYPSFFVMVPGGAPERLGLHAGRDRHRTPAELIAEIEGRMRRQGQLLLSQGSMQRGQRRLEEAIATLTRAIRMQPDDPQGYLERARAFAEQESFEDALEDLGRAARLRPEDPSMFGTVEELLGRQGRWNEVVACWTSFLDRNASDARAYLARAQALDRRGTPGPAQADRDKACDLGAAGACRGRATSPAAGVSGS